MSAYAPVKGPLFTKGFIALLAVAAAGFAVMAWRFLFGLGAVSAMSDGYPWGIWIAFDVVTGTGIACGGYAVALMVYVFNKGEYHPLVRPAILTTALGYSVAGFSVFIDIGRYWNAWRLAGFWMWNGNSVLLEVALCIMSYMVVSWIEVGHSILEKWEKEGRYKFVTPLARALNPYLTKSLPFIIALGILLPTMHQSSLGSLYVISTRVHPLWHTQFLPLLFLVSVLGMGYAGVVLESTLSGRAFNLQPEWKLLGKLSKSISWASFIFVAIRLIDLALRGFPGIEDPIAILFAVELALFLAPAFLLLSDKHRSNPGTLFASALMTILAGALYRFDVYLVAFDPGSGWHYFPTIPEMFVTFGLVAAEIAVYVFVVKRFPILRKSEAHS